MRTILGIAFTLTTATTFWAYNNPYDYTYGGSGGVRYGTSGTMYFGSPGSSTVIGTDGSLGLKMGDSFVYKVTDPAGDRRRREEEDRQRRERELQDENDRLRREAEERSAASRASSWSSSETSSSAKRAAPAKPKAPPRALGEIRFTRNMLMPDVVFSPYFLADGRTVKSLDALPLGTPVCTVNRLGDSLGMTAIPNGKTFPIYGAYTGTIGTIDSVWRMDLGKGLSVSCYKRVRNAYGSTSLQALTAAELKPLIDSMGVVTAYAKPAAHEATTTHVARHGH